jgi:hypothetical protein
MLEYFELTMDRWPMIYRITTELLAKHSRNPNLPAPASVDA